MLKFPNKTALAELVSLVKTGLSLKANDSDLAAVAKSGSYSDLSDKPEWSIDDDGNLIYTENNGD